MTAHTMQQMFARVFQTGTLVQVGFESIMIRAEILDVKSVWGRNRYLIQPVAGDGTQWVDETRIHEVR